MRSVKRAVFLACLVWAVGCAFAQSQPPAPSPTARAQNQQSFADREADKRAKDQRDASALSSAINELTSEIKRSGVESDRKSREENSPAHWWAVYGPNIVIALFTIVLAVVGLLQWGTYREGQKTTKSQLRAYVSFAPNFDHDPNANVDYRIVFNCTNHGATPALNIRFQGGIWKCPFPLDAFNLPALTADFNKGRLNLFPGEKMHERALGLEANTGRKFTEDEIDEVYRGISAFVIGLKIQYEDVFGKSHETQEFWTIGYKNRVRQLVMAPTNNVIT